MINIEVLLSGFIGTIVGGILSWITTSKALNKQFKFEQEMQELRSDWKLLKALYGIRFELDNNIMRLKAIKILMVEEKVDFINYKKSGMTNGLKRSKWDEYNSEIIGCFSLDLLKTFNAFYYNISLEINDQINSLERTEKQIVSALQCNELIHDEINRVEARVDTK